MFSGLGATTVMGIALNKSGVGSLTGDLLVVVAMVLCGLGLR
jgi:hypothetical protein